MWHYLWGGKSPSSSLSANEYFQKALISYDNASWIWSSSWLKNYKKMHRLYGEAVDDLWHALSVGEVQAALPLAKCYRYGLGTNQDQALFVILFGIALHFNTPGARENKALLADRSIYYQHLPRHIAIAEKVCCLEGANLVKSSSEFYGDRKVNAIDLPGAVRQLHETIQLNPILIRVIELNMQDILNILHIEDPQKALDKALSLNRQIVEPIKRYPALQNMQIDKAIELVMNKYIDFTKGGGAGVTETTIKPYHVNYPPSTQPVSTLGTAKIDFEDN